MRRKDQPSVHCFRCGAADPILWGDPGVFAAWWMETHQCPAREQKVWVVVQETPYEPSHVLGVYATKQLADLAADHPYDSMTVMEFPLVKPVMPGERDPVALADLPEPDLSGTPTVIVVSDA